MLHLQKPSLVDHCVSYLLRHKEKQFSPVFYALHASRVKQGLHMEFGCLTLICAIAALTILPIGLGYDSALLASIGAALLFFVVITSLCGTRDILRARILPYFEVPLGDTRTWLAGKALLKHSRLLDDSAQRLGVTPLSAFASGDPLIPGESHTMHDAAEALITVEALLLSPETGLLGSRVHDDLVRLQEALALAKARGVRFNLHLREGSTASGHEMDMRTGSYF